MQVLIIMSSYFSVLLFGVLLGIYLRDKVLAQSKTQPPTPANDAEKLHAVPFLKIV